MAYRGMALPITRNGEWQSLVRYGFTNLVFIGWLGAIARYGYASGKAFMVESLRNAERVHAINFGKLYLSIFADNPEWEQLKSAFEHWNIDIGSAFMSQSHKEIDPQILRFTERLAGAMAGKVDKAKSGIGKALSSKAADE